MVCSQNFKHAFTNGVAIAEFLEAGFDQEDIYAIMQGEIRNVQIKLDDLQRNDIDKYNRLIKFINDNRNQLELMNRYSLATNCGDAVAKGEFIKAAELLKHVLTSNFDEIILKSYKNSTVDFDKILSFANFVHKENDNKSLFLYQELFKQSAANATSSDLMNMATFIKNRYNQSAWTELKKNVLHSLVSKASTEIMSYLNIEVEKVDRKSYNLIDKVDALSQEAGLQLISLIVKKICKTTQSLYVLRYISQDFKVHLRVQGLITLYDLGETILVHPSYLFRYTVFHLARELQKAFKDPEIDAETEKQLIMLAESLPASIRSAAYSDKLCIQNKKSKNYLKVAKYKINDNWQTYLSLGDTSYERTKWTFKRRAWYFVDVVIRNSHSNSHINFMNINGANSTDPISFVIECRDFSEGLYLRLMKPGITQYIRDDEGELGFSMLKDDFAKWIFKSC